MASDRELAAMRQAIAVSALGLGTTSPNPPVGCVILGKDGDVAATGYHQRKGEPHAEAHAIKGAKDRARGGTAVVTLEPCNHFGRTPPCHQALIDAGITRVVIALIDPTSRAEGGAAKLRAAGIDVEMGVLADEARLVLGPWLQALATQRPIVIATPDAQPSAFLYATVDAVLTADGSVREAVPGSHGQASLNLPTVRLTLAPADLLNDLHRRGVRSVLLNAPANLIHTFADAHCVDTIVTAATNFDAPRNFELTKVTKLNETSIECVYKASR